MASQDKKKHVLLLPFMAQGHLRPFLHLARRLTSLPNSNLTVTLLTTPLNAASLSRSLSPAVRVAALPFDGSEHGLPPGVENTDKLPLTLVISLFRSSASLEPHLRRYLSDHFPAGGPPPLCVVFDVFLGWAGPVAADFGSPGIAFSTGGAYGTTAYCSIWAHLPHRRRSPPAGGDDDDDEFPVPGFPDTHRFHRTHLHRYLRAADGRDEWSTFFQPQIRSSMSFSSGWLCNSVEEIEPLGFRILRDFLGLPVWGVGPLIPDRPSSSAVSLSSDEDEGWARIRGWLDGQRPDSVLYVSFGSQNTIAPAQMMELAAGLEMSGRPFLWVIRPPFGFDINGELRPEWLPGGFEERARGRGQGMLVHKWGPQMEILGHVATGAFLTHCGWNSVLEGLREGRPMAAWPLAAEQGYNAKMLVEEMGVAVEMARGLEGEVRREGVRRVVEAVLGRGEGSPGREMKRRAEAAAEHLRDAVSAEGEYRRKGSSVRALDDFLDAVVSGRLGCLTETV